MTSQNTTQPDLEDIWQNYCQQIQGQLSPAVYNTWILSNPLTNVTFLDPQAAIVTITSPTAFHSTNLKKNFHEQIRQVFESVLERSCDVRYQVGEVNHQQRPRNTGSQSSGRYGSLTGSNGSTIGSAVNPPTNSSNGTGNQANPLHQINSWQSVVPKSPRVEDLFSEHSLNSAAEDRFQAQLRGIGLRADYTFETFAVSTSNEMAHAAATAVSNHPGQSYNPLFLYGGVGVGKTHLMHAIGNNILRNNPGAKILYCTGEEFTNDIVHAIQTKKARDFKERYRHADVLLLDDVQFIAGKNAVQEEFFHTFNALIKQLSQIVLTSDRPPHEITLLEDRLRSRFEAGLMIDIQQPSFELRTAIVLVKTKAQNIPLSIDQAKLVASKVESARKIEGVITSIRSEIELKHRQISMDMLEELLEVEVESKRPQIKVPPADVIKTVANHYKVKQSSIKGHSRVKKLVIARHVSMFLMKQELSMPLTEIGKWFAGRDHTSVLHAVRKINKESATNESLQQDISALCTTLSAVSR